MDETFKVDSGVVYKTKSSNNWGMTILLAITIILLISCIYFAFFYYKAKNDLKNQNYKIEPVSQNEDRKENITV